MSRYIPDTDHVILHQHGHLVQLGADDVAVTIITVEEQLRGRLDSIRRHSTSPRRVPAYTALQATMHYFQRLPVLDFTQAAYDRFAALRQSQRGGLCTVCVAPRCCITMVRRPSRCIPRR